MHKRTSINTAATINRITRAITTPRAQSGNSDCGSAVEGDTNPLLYLCKHNTLNIT